MQRLETTLKSISDYMEKHQTGPVGRYGQGQLNLNTPHSPSAVGSFETLQSNLARVAQLMGGWGGSGPAVLAGPRAPTLPNGLPSVLGLLSSPPPQPFPSNTFNLDVAPFHPGPTQVRTAWRVFLLNIDPLVKILHRSTTERLLHKAIRDPTSLSNGETAVIFTIYFSSLPAMSNSEAEQCFNIPKQAAISTYRSAAEHALMKIDLLTTNDLTTLQAFVLFLSLGRFTDHSTRVWALTGLVRRLDSISSPSTSPFEEEIRRRLRWELWYLDHRAHEDAGKGPAPPDTGGSQELPQNVKDEDLDPSSIALPASRPGWTEISFSLVRFEIARTARLIDFMPYTLQKLAMVDECERRIQSAYLRYCDGTEAIHWLARHVGHVLIMELRFKLLRHDRQYADPYLSESADPRPHPMQDSLFLKAIDIVDTPRRIASEPQAKQWSWLLAAYMQFWPLSFLLSELCHRHGSDEVDRAWAVAERALRRQKQDDTSKNMNILRQLMEKARLEKDLRVSIAPIEVVSLGANQPLSESSSTYSAALYTPSSPLPAAGNSMGGELNLARSASLTYEEFEESLSPPAPCNGLGWDGLQRDDYLGSRSLDFVFSEAYPFVDLDDSTSIASLSYPP
ncbi:uncharacterized protein DNG_05829 [Cephalotrichum gorgonifer]|uniref:Xylanolytic transcriptional activator regulatory domain-containing protein n=1 Tax=Cephalotrichum gorgonifer TaxID=2041049 RepID=A0AAE8N1L4_9PEZI|nr:uncharacterized protein DNG_05829 [Cephalotrichum gorgonifer]